jgi:hypothetical protein
VGVANHQLTDDTEPVAFLLWWVLDARATEGDVREALGVEEVGTAQVRVAVGDAGVDARCFDRGLDASVFRMIPVAPQRRLHGFEAAAHGGHHHVLHGELDARVRRVELPCGDLHRGRGSHLSPPCGVKGVARARLRAEDACSRE